MVRELQHMDILATSGTNPDLHGLLWETKEQEIIKQTTSNHQLLEWVSWDLHEPFSWLSPRRLRKREERGNGDRILVHTWCRDLSTSPAPKWSLVEKSVRHHIAIYKSGTELKNTFTYLSWAVWFPAGPQHAMQSVTVTLYVMLVGDIVQTDNSPNISDDIHDISYTCQSTGRWQFSYSFKE